MVSTTKRDAIEEYVKKNAVEFENADYQQIAEDVGASVSYTWTVLNNMYDEGRYPKFGEKANPNPNYSDPGPGYDDDMVAGVIRFVLQQGDWSEDMKVKILRKWFDWITPY